MFPIPNVSAAIAVGGMAVRGLLQGMSQESSPSPTIQKYGNTPLNYSDIHISGGLSTSYDPLKVEAVRRFLF